MNSEGAQLSAQSDAGALFEFSSAGFRGWPVDLAICNQSIEPLALNHLVLRLIGESMEYLQSITRIIPEFE